MARKPSLQPPLPGFGKAAVQRAAFKKALNKNPAKQPTLPGMGNIKREVAPQPEEPVEKPARERKRSSSQKLGDELTQGNLPMFMNSKEITKHLDLGDAGGVSTPLGGDKHPTRKYRERKMMQRKLIESRTGTSENSHVKKEYQRSYTDFFSGNRVHTSELPSLHESLSKDGYKGEPLPVSRVGRSKGTLINGHHRVAAMRNINPKQFLPIEWDV